MSKSWTPEELASVSAAMGKAGYMTHAEFKQELSSIESIYAYAKLQAAQRCPCPRCGLDSMADDICRNALSRYAAIQICDACGTDEAIRDASGQMLPFSEWAIAKNPHLADPSKPAPPRSLRRWNYSSHEYDSVEIPGDWKVAMYSDNMKQIINCVHCGALLEYGDAYTSQEYHNDYGFGFMVCPKCHKEELTRKCSQEE